jgi:ABC-type methionine transport system permease subunit
MTAAALIPIAIAALPYVQTGVTELIAWIDALVVAAKQSGEWTAAQDDAWRAVRMAKLNDPAYKPDA